MNDDNTVAIYCRLSKEDLDKDIGKTVSESIKNQKSMLETYALERHWSIYDFYVDEDYSGSDRDRPEFNRLITDSLLGNFNIVLCKKQARFARDIEYVEKYIHGLFVERQIRFVAMLDNIDTGTTNRSARKASQINSLVDEWYLADLSDNIVSSLTEKRKNAEFIGSWAPYGYIKNPNNKNSLVIDPTAAAIVKEIFHMYSNGIGITSIAQNFNTKLIPNPLTYKNQNGEKINPNPEQRTDKSHLWTPSTISSILHNKVYIGYMVQGKFKKASYKSKKLLRIPKSDWITIPSCHEPIIDEDVWNSVQKILNSRSRASVNMKKHHLLAGIVFCGECGSKLVSSGGTTGKRKTTYLCCSKRKISKEACVGSRIEIKKLEEILIEKINILADRFFDIDYLLKNIDFEGSEADLTTQNLSVQLKSLQDQINSIDKKNETLYSDKLGNLITQTQYIKFRDKLTFEKISLLNQFNILKLELSNKELSLLNQTKEFDKRKFIERYKHCTHLTKEMVNLLVDSIFIYKRRKGEPQEITINWNF